jgi:hypothetical protein
MDLAFLLCPLIFILYKLEIRIKQFLPSSKWVGRRGMGLGRGRNDPNIVCTYE